MMKGLFVTFEGVDGCGKSTQVQLVTERLLFEGYPVVRTREPGGTPLAEKIRSLLIDPDNSEMVHGCELLLYLAARAQHVQERIVPELNNGSIVICDRFQEATFAYQGFGRGLPMQKLQMLNEFATGGLSPDLTFLFDIPVEKAMLRMSAMHKVKDRLELGGAPFFERIRQGYLQVAKESPGRCIVLDGDLPREKLAETIYETIEKKIKERPFLR